MNSLKRNRRWQVAGLVFSLMVFGASGIALAQPVNLEQRLEFNIPAGKLADALIQFSKQASVQVLTSGEATASAMTEGVSGAVTMRDALTQLLRSAGLTFKVMGDNAVAVGQANSQGSALQDKTQGMLLAQADDVPPAEKKPSSGSKENAQEMVVTGTNLRGVYPASSPVEIYTAEDIARTGATTTAQFIQKLPQNAGTRTLYAPSAVGTGGGLNQEAVTGVDLRGLGIGTTLVLMNGRRLGLSDYGRMADVSTIPASAIERVEVLTDGASAIYGSDAIGGVVNFVLRKDFDGAETRLSYGGVSSGGLRQGDFTQTFGRTWGSGNGLISYSASMADPLLVGDRSYAAGKQRGTLTSEERRHNLLATFSQDLSDRFAVSADLALSRRDIERSSSAILANPLNSRLETTHVETDQIFANAALDYDFTQALRGSFRATYSKADVMQRSERQLYNATPPTITPQASRPKDYSALDLTAMLEGGLFALPGGGARFSVGAGVLDEEYSGNAILSTTAFSRVLGRSTGYAFGEAFLPLVGAGQDIPLVRRLELNVAARYTRYEDGSRPALHQEFGDAVDPKIGLLWALHDTFRVRGTYGTSFRTPTLTELDETTSFVQLDEGSTPIPFPSGPLATIIVVDGRPFDRLGPETATTYAFGFDFQPSWRSGLRVSATYYNISYEDRIAQPATNGLAFIQTPQLYASAIYRPPSAAFIEELIRATSTNFRFSIPGIDLVNDPAGAAQTLFNRPNEWILDSRPRNLAVSDQDGFDISVSDSMTTRWGQMRYGANATRIFSYLQQNDSNSPVVSVMDNATLPVSFRGRTYLGLSRGGFDGTVNVNYVDDYLNNFTASGIPVKIASWTTVDLSLSYDFGDEATRLLKGLRLSMSAQNLFDRDPPFVARSALALPLNDNVGFDPANANPLGRLVVLGISKKW